MRRHPTGLLRWLAILGPGLIATSAGNDAGGIATYSQAGAKFGYELIWVMVILTLSFAVVQEMCARLGAATGRGLLDLIRERFGIVWALFAVAIILIANGGITSISPDGLRIEHHPLPDSLTTNVCFGGPGLRTAYATLSGTGRLVSFEWPRPGLRLAY